MRQIIFDFGVLKLGELTIPLAVRGFGLMLAIGFIVGIALAQWRARRCGESADAISRCGILALVGGIAGARIAYVIQHWDEQFADAPNQLGSMLNVTSGGLTYYGGLVLAIVLVLGYMRIKKLPVRRLLDCLAVSVMIGLAFGRAGCLLNGCCFGGRSNEGWALGMRFPMYSRPLVKFDGRDNPFSASTAGPTPVYANQLAAGQIWPDSKLLDSTGYLIPAGDLDVDQAAIAKASWSHPVCPAQVFGIVSALLIAGILAGLHRLRKREGQIFAIMLILYPITRFVLESIRDTNPHDLARWVLTHNQYTSIGLFLTGVGLMFLLQKLPASAGATWTQRVAIKNDVATSREDKFRRNRRPNR